ncbi:Ig-like domain-containing protein [Hyphobacterium sp.]|uniref:Ig-like domain-containing protein n=1 Tax=Hyphobacterium sp. TaxID=2004662 RepID=UPI003BADB8E9
MIKYTRLGWLAGLAATSLFAAAPVSAVNPPNAVDDAFSTNAASGLVPGVTIEINDLNASCSRQTPAIDIFENGDYVVAHYDETCDVLIAFFSADGSPILPAFSTGQPARDLLDIDVAALPNGNAALTWGWYLQNGNGPFVSAQVFDRSGAAVAPSVFAEDGSRTAEGEEIRNRRVVPTHDGGFIVSWHHRPFGQGALWTQYYAIFNAGGALIGNGQFDTSDYPLALEVYGPALHEADNRVASAAITGTTAESRAPSFALRDLAGATIANLNLAAGGSFTSDIDLASSPDRQYAVAWVAQNQTVNPRQFELRAVVLTEAGAIVSGPFLVHSADTLVSAVNLDSAGSGQFVVSARQENSPDDVLALVMAFNSAGEIISAAFDAKGDRSPTATDNPIVRANAAGDTIALWMEYFNSGSGNDRSSLVRPFNTGPWRANQLNTLPLLANDSDADDDALTITEINGQAITPAGLPGPDAPANASITLPSGAVVTLAAGGVNYDPTAAAFALALTEGATGNDNFTYTVSDGASTDTATVTVTLTGVNDAPTVTVPAPITIDEDATDSAIAGVSIADPDGDAQTVTITAGSTVSLGTTAGLTFTQGNGTDDAVMAFSGALADVNAALATLTYTPTLNANGQSSISIATNDGNGGEDDASVTINITPVDDVPIAFNDTFGATAGDGGRTFAINQNAAGQQRNARVEALLDGGFIAIWSEEDDVNFAPLRYFATRAQRFDADGNPVGDELILSQAEGIADTHVDVVQLAGGRIVFLWDTFIRPDLEPDRMIIRVQVRSSDLTTVIADLTVGDDGVRSPQEPALAAQEGGAFAVVWRGFRDGVGSNVFFQAFGDDGGQVSPIIAVAGNDTNPPSAPDITGLQNGDYVVAWRNGDNVPEDPFGSIRARILTSTGLFETDEFIVPTLRVGEQLKPTVEGLTNGFFVVAWEDSSNTLVPPSIDVRARIFNRDGVPQGDDFLVNESIPGDQRDVRIAPTIGGGFAATWTDSANSGGQGVFMRRFSLLGAPTSPEVVVNIESSQQQRQPDIAQLTNEDLVVIWRDGTLQPTLPVGDEIVGRVFGDPVSLPPNTAHTLDVLANDIEPDGQGLIVATVDGQIIFEQFNGAGDAPQANQITLASGAIIEQIDNKLIYEASTAAFAIALPAGVTGNDAFTYRASDRMLEDQATATVTLTGVNDAPTAVDDGLATGEDDAASDVTAGLLSGDSDPDTGETAQLAVVSLNTAGTLGEALLNAGAVTYGPNGAFEALAAGEITTDSFAYSIEDPQGARASAIVTVSISGENDDPEARNDTFDIIAGRPLSGSLFGDNGAGADRDPDNGDSFSVTAVNGQSGAVGSEITLPSGAVLTVNASGSFNYISPALDPGAVDTDSFTYSIADSLGASNTATVTINQTGNNPPDARDDQFVANYPAEYTLNSESIFNAGGQSQGSSDVAELENGRHVIVWKNGSDVQARIRERNGQYSEVLSLGSVGSSTDDLNVIALPGGGFAVAPYFDGIAIFDANGNRLRFLSLDFDKIFDIVLLSTGELAIAGQDANDLILSSYSRDRLQLVASNSFREFPIDTNYDAKLAALPDGRIAIIYRADTVHDDHLMVREADAGFSSFGSSETLVQNQVLDGEYFISEVDGGYALAWRSLRDENLVECRSDSCDIQGPVDFVEDGIPRNISEFLVIGNHFFFTYSSGPRDFLIITDSRYDVLGPDILVTSSPIVAMASDAAGAAFVTDQSSVELTRISYSLAANQAHSIDVLINDSDPENDALTITQVNGEAISSAASRYEPMLGSTLSGPVTLPSGAVVSLNGEDLSYDGRPAGFAIALPAGVTGNDTFPYTISDGDLTDTAEVTINLVGVNDAPIADDDAATIGEDDTDVNLTATLLDGDSDPDTGESALLSISQINVGSTTGTAALNGGQVTYTPGSGFDSLATGQTGNDSFGYSVSDPGGLQASGTMTITITGANDAPDAADDAININEESAATDVTSALLANDNDPDSGETAQLVITAIDSAGAQGEVTLTNGVVTYDPNGAFNNLIAGQTAQDSFSYTVTDPQGVSDTATVTVTIQGFSGYALTVTTTGLGSGAVTSLPLGINCGGGGGCAALFTQNTEVALTANVAPGTAFEGWSGDCLDNSAALCVVSMTAARNVSARFAIDNPPDGRIVAATLPGARSGFVGGPPITVFMSVLSRQTTPAQACQISAPGTPPFTLSYQQLDGAGQPIGVLNPTFDLGNGGAISFVIALQPNTTTPQEGYTFLPQIVCENATLTPLEGINSVLVSIGAAPVPDILSIGTTPSADGVVRIPDSGNRISFLSAAALNIGTGDGSAGANQATVTASVDTGGTVLPVTLEVCETASTGGCITPRGETSTTSVFDQGVNKFFAVFVRANAGEFIPFDPANSRVFLRFEDATGAVRSVTSAAISAPQPAGTGTPALLTGRWSVLVRQEASDWPPLRRGALHILSDGRALLDTGSGVHRVTLTALPGGSGDMQFSLSGAPGLATSAGSIWLGDALSEEPGSFWGVRDSRAAPARALDLTDHRFGETISLSSSGRFSGQIGNCQIYGQADAMGTPFEISLTGCIDAGLYTGLIDPPANDRQVPVLLIANDVNGYRLPGALLPD